MEKQGASLSVEEPVSRSAKPLITSGGETILCGVLLAGGEGKRVESFIRSLRKDALPKQFVNFIGRRSMLEHTIDRAERLIPAERLFTVVNQRHVKYPDVKRQLSRRLPGTVVLQPENKETGPGLLLPLMHLYKRYPNSVTVVFPSDHYVLEEERLMNHVRLASITVQRDPSRLVLLGVKPDAAEPEYGYILPGRKYLTVGVDTTEISWFIEKPDPATARRLIESGALWNTMIMVFRTTTLLHWVRKLAPVIFSAFQKIYDAIGTETERQATQEVYQQLKPVNFSKELLEPMVSRFPSSVVTLPVRHVLWSDWGTEDRILEIVRRTGKLTRLNGRSKAKQPGVYRETSPAGPSRPGRTPTSRGVSGAMKPSASASESPAKA